MPVYRSRSAGREVAGRKSQGGASDGKPPGQSDVLLSYACTYAEAGSRILASNRRLRSCAMIG